MLFTSNSVSDTYQLAKRFTQNISKGNIIALIGDLGTGKTTFTQGVAEALGIKENVGSPTFKLVSEYKGEDSWLYHIDAYRLKGSNDFLNIGGEEYLNTEIQLPELALLDFDYSADEEEPETLDDAFYRATVKR